MKAPRAMQHEHQTLHLELDRATRAGGRTADAASTVARLLHPHFFREDEYAMPPLSLLPTLAEGRVEPEMREVLPLVARLKAELPLMLKEHRAILAALVELAGAAADEEKPEIADFARRLMHHAETEEEILYPAAILVGEYLQLKLGAQGA